MTGGAGEATESWASVEAVWGGVGTEVGAELILAAAVVTGAGTMGALCD